MEYPCLSNDIVLKLSHTLQKRSRLFLLGIPVSSCKLLDIGLEIKKYGWVKKMKSARSLRRATHGDSLFLGPFNLYLRPDPCSSLPLTFVARLAQNLLSTSIKASSPHYLQKSSPFHKSFFFIIIHLSALLSVSWLTVWRERSSGSEIESNHEREGEQRGRSLAQVRK